MSTRFKLHFIALIGVCGLLFSCGKDSAMDSSQLRVIDSEIATINLKFQTISPKHYWQNHFSRSILNYLERSELTAILDQTLNVSDLRILGCTGYNRANLIEKKRFWVVFMASIAHAESSLNPMTTYREKDGTLSSGLLQIDLASANRHSYPYTGFSFSQNHLFNTDLNLMAGLYVMKHQLSGGIFGERPELIGRLFTNTSYYWSVLTLKRELIIKTFSQNKGLNLPFCSIGE